MLSQPIKIPTDLIKEVKASTTRDVLTEINEEDSLQGQFLLLVGFVVGINDRYSGYAEDESEQSKT